MKSLPFIALLFTFSVALSPVSAGAAIAKFSPSPEQMLTAPVSGKISKKEKKREGRLARLKTKLVKKFEKLKQKLLNGTARDYLVICLTLLLVAIIFFALNGSAGVFNVFGSVAAIGAAVFFVLWLLELKKG